MLTRFPTGYDVHWDDIKHRREFLMAFAKKEGFDPLKAENWTETKSKLTEYGVRVSLCIFISFLFIYIYTGRPVIG